MEVEFHRFILAEINTHRTLSRNYQSSRAVPVSKMLEQVESNPAIPVHFGKNQRGMVAEEETDSLVFLNDEDGNTQDIYTGLESWIKASQSAVQIARAMDEAGYHKQIVNRILEPYVWTRGVITATRSAWMDVLKLRLHRDAQPEFRALAVAMKEAIECSIPMQLDFGHWHLPYVEWGVNDYGEQEFFNEEIRSISDAIKVSTSCCGQVSYRVLDDSLDKAMRIYSMLNLPINGWFSDDPPHFSPCEHQAMALSFVETMTLDARDKSYFGGNFNTKSFYQYRKMLEQGKEQDYI
jgi:hypothetical protein